jgi:hypothetical protein
MPITLYINGPTLSSSTAIFTDAAMTTCAPNGYYADGPVVRQQVDCVLLPEQECPFCGVDCEASSFKGPVNQGVYYMSVNLSSTVGPVVITFNPLDYPNGIEVTYDSTVYNTVVSPFFGPLSAPSGLPVFVGLDTEDCGIVGTHTLEEYEFIDDGVTYSFSNLGTTDVVNVATSQMNLTWASPGNCIMVIPKPFPTPDTLLVKVISPCGLDSFQLEVQCPNIDNVAVIPGSAGGSEELICGYDVDTIFYNSIPVNGDGTTLGLYDFMYYDFDCTTPLEDNYYLSSSCPAPNSWFRIENGIIVEFGECEASFLYSVRKCGDLRSSPFTVISSFTIPIGITVSLSDPIYDGCRFEVLSIAAGPPVASVTTKHNDPCSSVCSYYKVYNLESSTALVAYDDCAGFKQEASIPVHSFIYLCALIDSITSSSTINVIFESCECPA